MKKNNPPKKLRLLKKTIAHLNDEQMFLARGGEIFTKVYCTKIPTDDTFDCPTNACGDSNNFSEFIEICS
ncbi:MAG: class I lanthipeptide [Candidatus Aminicenantes bacterium]|jgi:hypothetical protein